MEATSTYKPRPTNSRRSKTDTRKFYDDIVSSVDAAGGYLTLRHLFYRLVSAGTIPKTEAAYNNLLHHTKIMRQKGILPYSVFADNTRLRRKSRTYKSLEDALNFWSNTYRQELWLRQDCYVEIWSEKDAISNIIVDVTDNYHVPLMVARGFSSLTFLYNAAEEIMDTGKPAFIYHLGDLDPSGVKAAEDIHAKLLEFGCYVQFERLAVTRDQVEEYSLPTRPTKSNTHSKGWKGDSVEIDAMDPGILKSLVRNAIISHIDFDELEKLKADEAVQRDTLRKIRLPNSL